MDEVINSAPPMPVGYQYPVFEGVERVILSCMDKSTDLLSVGEKNTSDLWKCRAVGALEVYSAYKKTGDDKNQAIEKCSVLIGECQLAMDFELFFEDFCIAVDSVVIPVVMFSREAKLVGDIKKHYEYREVAIGALNVFDLCASKEEKKSFRKDLLDLIFPVVNADA